MFRGLYTAGSAMITNNRVIDVISNNMANANTVSFKKDLVLAESFEDTLIRRIDGSGKYPNLNSGRVKVAKEDNYSLIEVNGGYLRNKTPDGISYSTSTKVAVDAEGYLSTYYKDGNGKILTENGYRLQGQNGPIKVDDKAYEITENGDVMVDGEKKDNILAPVDPKVIGTMNSGIKIERIVTDFSQGQLNRTNNQLDFAIDGDGFLKVKSPMGDLYTRDGRFKINSKRELTTMEGYNVLNFKDEPIVLEDNEITVNPLGEIIAKGQTIDKFRLVNIENQYDLQKHGAGFYTTRNGKAVKEVDFEGQVLQGTIEETNVLSMKEMIELLSSYRSYEANQKVIRSYDETIGKAVNEVGRT